MNKKQVFPAISIVFLFFMFVVSLIQFFSDLLYYGWTYNVTTTILDVVTNKTVNVAYELVGCFFFVWFLFISIQNYQLISEKQKTVEEVNV